MRCPSHLCGQHLCPEDPIVSGMPSVVSIDDNNICRLVQENCAPYDVTLQGRNVLGMMEIEDEDMIPLTDDFISSVCHDIYTCFLKVKRKRLSRDDIQKRSHLQVADEFKEQYIDILHKHQDALSINKYDLRLAKDFMHKI
jgi:hypothetical protein